MCCGDLKTYNAEYLYETPPTTNINNQTHIIELEVIFHFKIQDYQRILRDKELQMGTNTKYIPSFCKKCFFPRIDFVIFSVQSSYLTCKHCRPGAEDW